LRQRPLFSYTRAPRHTHTHTHHTGSARPGLIYILRQMRQASWYKERERDLLYDKIDLLYSAANTTGIKVQRERKRKKKRTRERASERASERKST
jgi:hypothetical protein